MKIPGMIALTLVLFTNTFADVCNGTYKDIVNILPNDWIVTATTNGRHNTGSRHYKGKAVDLSVRFKNELDVFTIMSLMEQNGFIVKDERTKPIGQRVWTGPHLHIYVPECKEEIVIDIIDET